MAVVRRHSKPRRTSFLKSQCWAFDPERGTIVECDASDHTVGGVLSQRGEDGELYRVAFFSTSMAAERVEKENRLDKTFEAIRIIWRYKLLSAVPLDGSASYEEIAATSGLYKPLVFRAIRAAIGNNIFDEDDSGRVRHMAISRLLATDQGFYDAIGLEIEDFGSASTKVIEAWETYGQDTGEGLSRPQLSILGRSISNET
ncbi:hypothetical protein GJ744_000319 [Endocarpon pusillum]|uniref:Reverse transcriptase/retrotransposon-derived protein RNase H-like domain-containing protein n=1 Tax=Endocarpon pusillum TaxID=364733 RepID=A0A8H7ATN1_9EURO|nr:hypothetical protein GJ744_000319 [Endocarpon pusillum]